jgi:hypothetical protein
VRRTDESITQAKSHLRRLLSLLHVASSLSAQDSWPKIGQFCPPIFTVTVQQRVASPRQDQLTSEKDKIVQPSRFLSMTSSTLPKAFREAKRHAMAANGMASLFNLEL